MSIFSSIKNAFIKKVSVNLESTNKFDFDATEIPVTLSFQAKEPQSVTNITISVERIPMDAQRVTDEAHREILGKIGQPISLLLEPGVAQQLNFTVPITVGSTIEAAANAFVEEHIPEQITGFLKNAEKLMAAANSSRDYQYSLVVDTSDSANESNGQANIEIFLLKPGQVITSFNIST